MKKQIELLRITKECINSKYKHYDNLHVLLVDKLCCSSATRDELNTIFKSADIKLVLFEDICPDQICPI